MARAHANPTNFKRKSFPRFCRLSLLAYPVSPAPSVLPRIASNEKISRERVTSKQADLRIFCNGFLLSYLRGCFAIKLRKLLCANAVARIWFTAYVVIDDDRGCTGCVINFSWSLFWCQTLVAILNTHTNFVKFFFDGSCM